MTNSPRRVLAIHPTTSGFGWVLFDGPSTVVDRDVATIAGDRNSTALARIEALIVRTQPSELVMEDADSPGSQRKQRIRDLYHSILVLADAMKIETAVYTRADVAACFEEAGVATRFEIATVIAQRFPELAHLLPPKRKIWLPEHPRMGLFDAIAVAVTHYWLTNPDA